MRAQIVDAVQEATSVALDSWAEVYGNGRSATAIVKNLLETVG